MRFAISIPQHVPDGTFDPAALRAYLARAEALGFESAWTGEQVIGSMPHLGPIDVGLARNERLRRVLHDYFAWATTTTMSRYHDSAEDVPDGLHIPKWSWHGLVSGAETDE